MKINIIKGKGKKAVIIKTIRLFSADMASEQATAYIAAAGDDTLYWDWA